MKVVLDTNIYISALTHGGTCERLLRYLLKRQVKIFLMSAIFDEITAVLTKKFNWSPERVGFALEAINDWALPIQPLKWPVESVTPNSTDNLILASTAAVKADFLVTGDKRHLLGLKEYRDVKIVSPAEFLNIIKRPQEQRMMRK